MDQVVSNIALIGAGVGFFLAAVLLLHRGGPPGTRTLGLIMLLIGSGALLQHLVYERAPNVVYLAFFWMPAFFYAGPLTYIYTHKVLFRSDFGTRRYLIHAIPALVMLVFHAVVHVIFPQDFNIESIRSRTGFTRYMAPVIALLLESCAGLYALAAYRKVQGYQLSARDQFAHDIDGQIRWLRLFLMVQLIGYLVHAPVVIASFFLGELFPVNIVDAIFFTGMVFLICHYLIRQPQVFKIPDPPAEAPAEAGPKYEKQGLEQTDRVALLERLDDFMREEQAFLDDDINLQQVAASLEIPPHHISMSINLERGLNFFSYVNGFRLEEVTRMLADPDMADENVLNLAFRAGFRSKAAFNRVFKEHAGLSPREYRRQALAATG